MKGECGPVAADVRGGNKSGCAASTAYQDNLYFDNNVYKYSHTHKHNYYDVVR